MAESRQGWCAAQHVPERERLFDVALGRALTARGFPSTHAGGRNDRHRVRVGLRFVEQQAPGLRTVK